MPHCPPSCRTCIRPRDQHAWPGDPHRVDPVFGAVLQANKEGWQFDGCRFGRPVMPDPWIGTNAVMAMSKAAGCDRALSYTLNGIPKSNPSGPAALANMDYGTLLHALWQALIDRHLATWQPRHEVAAEVPLEALDLTPQERDELRARGVTLAVRGFIDVLAVRPALRRTIVAEGKFPADSSWKSATGQAAYRDAGPEGPSLAYLTQLALEVHAPTHWRRDDGTWHQTDAPVVDEGRLVMGAKAATAQAWAELNGLAEPARNVAEWAYSRDELAPFYEAELERLTRIARAFLAGMLAPKRIPGENHPTIIQSGGDLVARSQIRGLFGRGRWFERFQGFYERSTQIDDEWVRLEPGLSFSCSNCDHRDLCHLIPGVDPAGRERTLVPVTEAVAAQAEHTTNEETTP